MIAVGSELLTPYRMDTNSLYLTEQLNLLGVDVLFKTIVGDDLRRLVAAAQHALFRSDIVIFSGGLGPTEDDLTREAVAEALGVGLRRDPEIVRALEERFAARGWKMTANNSKQADIIEGATVLFNPNGTAPGQWLNGQFDGREHIIILLRPSPRNEGAVRKRSCRAPARESSTRAPIHSYAESRHARRIRRRRPRCPDLQALSRCGDHHSRRRRRNRTPLQNSRRHPRRRAGPRRRSRWPG